MVDLQNQYYLLQLYLLVTRLFEIFKVFPDNSINDSIDLAGNSPVHLVQQRPKHKHQAIPHQYITSVYVILKQVLQDTLLIFR